MREILYMLDVGNRETKQVPNNRRFAEETGFGGVFSIVPVWNPCYFEGDLRLKTLKPAKLKPIHFKYLGKIWECEKKREMFFSAETCRFRMEWKLVNGMRL